MFSRSVSEDAVALPAQTLQTLDKDGSGHRRAGRNELFAICMAVSSVSMRPAKSHPELALLCIFLCEQIALWQTGISQRQARRISSKGVSIAKMLGDTWTHVNARVMLKWVAFLKSRPVYTLA